MRMFALILAFAQLFYCKLTALDEGNSVIAKAVTDIIHNFFARFSPKVKSAESNRVDKAVSEVLQNLDGKISTQIETNSSVRGGGGKLNFVILCEDFEQFDKIFLQNNSQHFDNLGNYLIVFVNNENASMAELFEKLWSRFVVNVNVLIANESEVSIQTYYPYSKEHCGKAVPVKFNRFHNGKWLKTLELFPNKMKNLFNCDLHVAVFKVTAFMIVHSKGSQVEIDGIEAKLLKTLSSKMNFNLKLRFSRQPYGLISSNGTTTGKFELQTLLRTKAFKSFSLCLGVIRMIVEKEVNLTLGFFTSSKLRDELMTASYPHHISSLVWVVPPGKALSSLEKLAKPFQLYLWLCIALATFITLSVAGLLKLGNRDLQNILIKLNIHNPGFDVVRIILGQALTSFPKKNFARIILTAFILYCFVIQNSYQGALFSFIQKPLREKGVETTDEMLSEGFTFYTMPTARPFIAFMPEVLERSRFIPLEDLRRTKEQLKHSDFKGALLSSVDILAWDNANDESDVLLNYSPEIICTNNVVIYMTKDSCLVDEINEINFRILNAGLFNKWTTDIIDPNFLKRKNVKKIEAFNFLQLSGAFQLLSAGLCLSFFVFILELFVKQCKSFEKKNFQIKRFRQLKM